MEFNLGTLVLWGASIISIYLVVIIPIINVLKFRRIPSHEAYPILGNLIAMWKCHDEFNKLFERWASKYGRGPVVVWGTYWFPIVVLGDAKDVKKVLCSRDHVSKGLFYRALDLAIGTGAFNAPVGIWKQRRPHLEQAFHSKVLQRLPSIFYLSSCELIQALQKDGHDTSGQTFDIHPYLSRCSIQMLIGGALGLEVDTFGGASKEFWKLAIQNYTRGTFLAEYRMLRPWYLFSSKIWNLTRLSKEMRTSVEWLHKFLFSQFLADKKRVDHEKNSTVQSSDKIMPQPKNFLELLLYLQNTKPELELSDQELIYEISSIYIAGTDATSKTLSFLILSLALHHDIQEKVREELDAIFASDDNTKGNYPITETHCNKMRYLECCIKETLRLFPPVSCITRRVGSDIYLDDGGHVPTGTEVVISIFSVHRNPSVYPDPNIFNPNRFLHPQDNAEMSTIKIGPFDWIPFSAGPRNCLGPKFAMVEIKVVAANIFRNYKVMTGSFMKMEDWVLHTNITLDLQGGWNIKLVPR